ncbi:putative necrosis-inducing factor-domain-containing protein [Podospora fimiseda]|uniref:Necrosis-inducing factor-domain-containing protein n=1 Tax=Podospora fimiseda TaxID=252190 RepID=A0AAN7GQA5_9PEZI|nr:putative necrosis-inducing factor-domain-containing protein [Podospora fimiseda]
MRFASFLAFVTAVSGAAIEKVATSPDGYTYEVVDESLYVPETITHADGTTSTVLIHPAFKWKRNEEEVATSPNVEKRLEWRGGGFGHDNQCGASTFINKSSGGSPKTTDCVKIRDHYRTANGYFQTYTWDYGSHWTRLVITGTCVFGVKSKNGAYPRIGSEDISDLTKDAINRFKTSDSPSRVGAEGNMGCNVQLISVSGSASVNWAIFHN